MSGSYHYIPTISWFFLIFSLHNIFKFANNYKYDYNNIFIMIQYFKNVTYNCHSGSPNNEPTSINLGIAPLKK